MIDTAISPTAIIVSIAAGVISGVLVRIFSRSRYEKNFKKNAKTTYDSLFYHVSRIDAYKQNIYKIWESYKFDENSAGIKTLTAPIYQEVQNLRNLIFNEIGAMTFHKNSPYVLISEYLLLMQYCLSVHSHLYEIANRDNAMSMNKKSLEYHMFYAKEIINTFKDFVPKNFIRKWELEFEKLGGREHVVKPTMEPGDILSPHYNFQNEAMYFDSQYTSIMKLLREIK